MKRTRAHGTISWSLWNLTRFGFCVLVGCAGIWAAIDRGTIRGTVIDPQAGAVPQVQVTITDVDTGVQQTARTNSAGFYLFLELAPGLYSIRFEARGFAPDEVTRIEVKANQVFIVNMQLRLGATTQHAVAGANQLLGASATNTGTHVSQRYVEDLPMLGRDTQTLVALAPGVTSSAGPPGSVVGLNGAEFGGFPDPTHIMGSFFSSNGGQSGSSAWYLDGNLNSAEGQDNMVVDPPPDALAEFQTITGSFAAEYGRTGGAVCSQILKSGANNVHGDLYAYNRNSRFEARNPMTQIAPSGQAQPPNFVNWNQFGGTIGGPLTIPHIYNGKNKTFFFAAWDISLLHEKGPFLGSVPTLLERQGDFSELPNVVQYGLFDPMTTAYNSSLGYFTRQPFKNPDGTLATSLPANRLDPVASWFMNQFPAPNYLDPRQQNAATGGCLNTCNNHESNYGNSQTSHSVVAKVDHDLSQKNKVFLEWLYNPSYYTLLSLPWTGPTAPLVGFNGTFPWQVKNHLATMGETHTFNPTLVNEFRFTFGRQAATAMPVPSSMVGTSEVVSHLQGLNIPLNPPLQPDPVWEIGGLIGSSFGSSFGSPLNNMIQATNSATVLDNVTKVLSRHTIKAGFMYRTDLTGSVFPTETILDFGGQLTNNPATGSGGNSNAQFMLGAVDQSSYRRYVDSTYGSNHYVSFYIQDDYLITPKLTLNFGLRYDIFTWWNDRHNNAGVFNPHIPNPDDPIRTGGVVYMATPQHPNRRPFPANKNDFAPRLNFSYSPFADGRTAIRGGIDQIYSDDITMYNGQGVGASQSVGYTPTPNYANFDASGHGLFGTNQVPGFILGQGAPSQPPIPDPKATNRQWLGIVGSGVRGAFFTMVPFGHDPYMIIWNLQVQHQLQGNLVITVGYAGSKGTHIPNMEIPLNYVPTAVKVKYRSKLNQLVPMPADLVPAFPASYYMSQLFMPFPQYLPFDALDNANNNICYNELQAKVEKRFSHGFDVLATYSNQKNIVSALLGGLVSNTWTGGPAGATSGAKLTQITTTQNFDNIQGDRALAGDDTPQSLNTAISYTLPFGPGGVFASKATGVTRHIVEGWKITANFNAQSGKPLGISGASPTSSGASSTGVQGSGACNTLTCRVNLIGDPNAGRSGKTRYELEQQYLNPGAFEAVFGSDPAIIALATTGTPTQKDPYDEFWRFGTAGLRLGNARSPGFSNVNASIGKDFIVSESKRFEFRANAFNALNHQNLGTPNTNWCLGPNGDGSTDAVHQFGCQFGRITTVQTDPRAWQFSLKFVF